MAAIFDVIADPTRREVLQVLLERQLAPDATTDGISVGEIVEKLGLSQPTVSKHLRVLRDTGLVTVREGGQHRYYSLDSAPLEEIEDWLVPFLASDAVGDTEAEPVPDVGSAVYAAWAGAPLTAPFRRAVERLPQAGEAGAAVGRVVAEVSHQARAVIGDATTRVEHAVLQPLKKRLNRPGVENSE
jgi:ArsR family transcriptional regulator, arsenate/arsenite/antimonite-responsive transcriptional repressor